MKAFIAIAKYYKAKYKADNPFLWVMCKSVLRDDVKGLLDKYEVFKHQEP